MKAKATNPYALLLGTLFALFCLRVVGQVLVAFVGVSFLPPMEEWHSGLLPYPVLIGSQALIVGLLFKVCLDFVRGHGVFVAPNPRFARFVVPLGRLYFLAMVVRYVVRMSLYPEARWLGGTIPIFFHWVLASYLMAFGRFHRTQLAQSGAASPRSSGMAAAEIPREAREEGICR